MIVYDEASSLFEIDEPAPSLNVLAPLPIKTEQIQAIRDAFERAGMVSQDDRKALIESVVVREVMSLRELKAVDALRILKRIEGLRSPKPTSTGSAWDNREEDTWIDKL
jgi:DNA polymerase-3 subunit epsilon